MLLRREKRREGIYRYIYNGDNDQLKDIKCECFLCFCSHIVSGRINKGTNVRFANDIVLELEKRNNGTHE